MIKNDRQYRITRAKAARFEIALRDLSALADNETGHDILKRAQSDALRSQLNDLRSELADYDALKSGTVTSLRTETFGELPAALIRARIATGLTQKGLAAKLGLKAQQVQKYEATDYASVSVDRIRAVIGALGIEVREEISLPVRHV